MKLTKLKALRICKELWTWMRDQRSPHYGLKEDWPGWSKYGAMAANCPCCEFSEQNDDEYCLKNCLLAKTWRGECCTSIESPFAKFGRSRLAKKSAQAIIDGCTREIRKLKAATERKVARKKK